jgi:FkbM family methyltransferase
MKTRPCPVAVFVLIVLLVLPLVFCGKGNWLVQKYGPKLYSQYDEELVIRDFFQDRKDGFFVDVGANDYRVNSTTFYLEEKLGWHGIAIDALGRFAKGYAEHRPNTRFFCFFVSDRSDASVDFYVTQQKYGRRSSSDAKWAQKWDLTEKETVKTITLDDLLALEDVRRIDLLTMDIELAEPSALAGFDIERFRPALVCVEVHKEVRQALLDYFTKHCYVALDTYRDVDRVNTYFTPAR